MALTGALKRPGAGWPGAWSGVGARHRPQIQRRRRQPAAAAWLTYVVLLRPGLAATAGNGRPNGGGPGPAAPLIHFVHVPKTGGSTVGLALKRHVGARFDPAMYKDEASAQGCAAASGGGEGGRGPCARTLAAARATPNCTVLIGCVLSHVPRMAFLSDPGAVSITMLREPAARLASGWFHGYPHTGDATRGCGKPPSCLAYASYIEMRRYRNVAVRMIGGDRRPYTDDAVQPGELAAAKEALGRFDCVGISEALYTSAKLCFHVLGWPFDAALLAPPQKHECRGNEKAHCHDMAGPSNNRKARKNRMSYTSFLASTANVPATRARANKLNALDLQLWQHAGALFCDRLQAHRDAVLRGDPRALVELQKAAVCPGLPPS